MAEKAILFDSSKCIACRACQVACKQWWELPAVPTINRGTYENPPDLSAQTWNRIKFKEIRHNGTVGWLFTRQACMHCTTAVCVWVCPSYARAYNKLGFVTIDTERCIGCGRCVEYCPFNVPRLDKNDVSPRVTVQLGTPRKVAYKCKFCEDRVEDGLAPACAKTCPSGAIQFGERAELVTTGSTRAGALKATWPKARLYGEKELGGLHVMYVLTDEPGVHGLPENPQVGTYPRFDENTFPAWYVKALAEGRLPIFPPEIRQEWYMQPNLIPVPAPPEPVLSLPAARAGPLWASQALLGWFGVGIVGAGTALWWTMRRRTMLDEQNHKGDKVGRQGGNQ